VQDAVTSSSSQQGTGSLDRSTTGLDAEHDDSSMMYRVGQAAMVLSGAALVAIAARQGKSWRSIGAAALAGAPLAYRGATGHWPGSQPASRQALDTAAEAEAETKPSIHTALTIDKPRAELYAFWRRLENLPRFMKNLTEVTDLGNGRSHWVGKSALGLKAQWDAEIVEEREGQFLSWRSLPGSMISNAGTVSFEESPNGRGTIVRVTMDVGTGLGKVASKLGGANQQEVREDLRRFKELMETGEVATTDGQPHGTRSLIGHLRNPI
jgi:uncharacterized membrane protein